MFKINDVLRYSLDKFDADHSNLDPVIFASLRKLAEDYRFKILEVTPSSYKIKRVNDGKENIWTRQETETSLVLATDSA